jgi:hypothetical protein
MAAHRVEEETYGIGLVGAISTSSVAWPTSLWADGGLDNGEYLTLHKQPGVMTETRPPLEAVTWPKKKPSYRYEISACSNMQAY